MERKQLEELGIEKENIDKIMDINGDDIENAKKESKKELEDSNAKLKLAQDSLDEANKTIESFKDVDIETIKKESENWKIKAENVEKEKLEIEQRSVAKDLFRNAKDELSLNALVDEFIKKDLKYENGKFLGAEEVKNEFTEKYSSHFEVKNPEPNPNPNNDGKGQEGFDLGGAGIPSPSKKTTKELLYGN